MSEATQLRIAQIFGVTSAGWLSGYIASMSIAGIPAVSQAPPSVAPRQWRTIYDIGIGSAPKIALASASAFAFAAFSISRSRSAAPASITSDPVYLLSAAALSTVLIAPWTIVTMRSTNELLDAKLATAETGIPAKEDEELQTLLKKWAGLNGIRSVFPLLGAVLGLLVITS